MKGIKGTVTQSIGRCVRQNTGAHHTLGKVTQHYQPAGQQVYHMVFDAQQQLLRVEQVLQEAYFQRLRIGQDRREDVYHYFGKPALVEHVANFKGDIWTYRIRENSIDRQAHVFIDPQGIVQRVMFLDEPRNDPEDRH